MSYHVYMEIDTGGEDPATVAEIGNHTSNCARMWDTAVRAAGFDGRFREMEGMSGADAIPILQTAISHMGAIENREAYEAMEPPNGWGSYESALGYLENTLSACRRHPKASLHFST